MTSWRGDFNRSKKDQSATGKGIHGIDNIRDTEEGSSADLQLV